MKILRTTIVSALTALSLLGAPALVSAHTTNNNPSLHLYEHAINDKNVNIFTGQDKRGNYQVFYNPVYDSSDQKLIGHSSGSCVYTSNTFLECTWSVQFKDGSSISFEAGEAVNATNFVSGVTSGTGKYNHIQAQARLHVFTSPSGVLEFEYYITR